MGILKTLIYNLDVSINHHYYAHTVKSSGPTGWVSQTTSVFKPRQREAPPNPLRPALGSAELGIEAGEAQMG